MISRADVTVGQLTDTGLLREQNQDSLAYDEPAEPEGLKRRGRLLIVADGVGGHPGGDKASSMAVAKIRELYSKAKGNDPPADLRTAFAQANRAIYKMSRKQKMLQGMGTTCSALVLRGTEAYVAHVGDSRVYIIRMGRTRLLTKDHSAAWGLLESGELTKEEYERHPKSRVIQRSLGFQANVDVDISLSPLELQPGDVFLLCSDGLTGVVGEEEISNLATQFPPQEACQRLVARANQKGGPDNITVLIARVESLPEGSA